MGVVVTRAFETGAGWGTAAEHESAILGQRRCQVADSAAFSYPGWY